MAGSSLVLTKWLLFNHAVGGERQSGSWLVAWTLEPDSLGSAISQLCDLEHILRLPVPHL